VDALVAMCGDHTTGWWERDGDLLPSTFADIVEEDHYLTDSLEALRTLITDIKAGKADHLL
jgi:hypothetical protein